ncbi:sensor histidine kinase, partial [Leucobacter sp. M11]|uniref:sensor histidine kinase n=1 Tax=Leucobacter sp. M11 TaxID=2993565 RepID=UPI002D7EDB3D
LALIAFLIDLTAGASLVTLIAVTDTSYAVARYGSRRLARTQLWMLGCGLPLFIAGGMIARTQLIDLLLGTLFLSTLFLLPIWWGTSLRLERDRTDLERQLGEGRLELLRSQQREETRAALAADRAVTGAELHDLVANQLAAIALRAEAAELGQAAGRAVTDTDLAAIAGASRSALRHLHDLIGLLREEPGVGVPERSADTLPGVLTQARALGSPVRWLGGDPEADGFAAALDAMPPEAGREILRILTEALVNAARHGADAEEGSGGVALRWLAGERTLSVTNAVREGRPPTAAGGGIGQRTMAERAARIGATIESGQLRAGEASAADGAPVRTWTVAITLPAPASGPGIARRADGAPGGEA